jgi:DNA-binding transcriptional ArsR family regulator
VDENLSLAGEPDVAAVGALLGDGTRARMLVALADGRELSAGALAAEAGVSGATASAHLAKLSAAGLVQVRRAGRYRYYRLAGADVASLIETLEYFAPRTPVRSPRQVQRAQALREARICYDHLAGRVGVAVAASLTDRGAVEQDRLTVVGAEILTTLGIRSATVGTPLRQHLDSSERRPHIHGALGTALLERFIELDWLERAPVGRGVTVTGAGRHAFNCHLGVEF